MLLQSLPANAAEGIVTYKSLSPDVAFDLARTALFKCRKDGYQVAVVVLDRFGAPLVSMRDRYAGIGAMDIATGKAWTAVNFSLDTAEFVKRVKDGTLSPGLASLPKVTPLVGGLIIKVAGRCSAASASPARPAATKTRPAPRPGSTPFRTSSIFS